MSELDKFFELNSEQIFVQKEIAEEWVKFCELLNKGKKLGLVIYIKSFEPGNVKIGDATATHLELNWGESNVRKTIK